MEKTLVVWRRLGKEHGEDCGYRVNPQDIISKHIMDKIILFRNTAEDLWRWWQVNETLLVEKSEHNDVEIMKTYYYLPNKNWLIIKNFDQKKLEDGWKWYVHIGKMKFEEEFNSWIFTDWFSDVIVKDDDITHNVLDLDELGNALRIGLIDSKQIVEILSSTQELIETIRSGNFPPKEIKDFLD